MSSVSLGSSESETLALAPSSSEESDEDITIDVENQLLMSHGENEVHEAVEMQPLSARRSSVTVPRLHLSQVLERPSFFARAQRFVRNNLMVVLVVVLLIAFAIAGFLFFTYAPASVQSAPAVILISIDGFRWDYIHTYAKHAPNLVKLVSEGVHAHYMEPIFPSKTFPNHYTIVTGLYAESHGIVGNQMWDPLWKETYSINNPEKARDGKWYGGEPLWVTVEKAQKKSACYFWPGSEAEIAGFRPSYYMNYNHTAQHDERVTTVLEWLRLPEAERPSFVTLYFSDVDTQGHLHGPDYNLYVATAIEAVDRSIGQLLHGLDKQGQGDTNIVIVSDHGMTATSEKHVIFLDEYIDVERVLISPWSPTAFLFPREDSLDLVAEIERNLTQSHPNITIYHKENLPRDYHFHSHRRIAPILVTADLGWSVSTHENLPHIWNRHNGGDHGYNNTLPDMRAFFAAKGPAFKAAYQRGRVKNIDIYSMLAYVLQVPEAPNNGTVYNMADILINPPKKDEAHSPSA